MPWKCPNCQSDVQESFELCWNCGTSTEGVPDPEFGRPPKPAAHSPPPYAAGSQAILSLAQVCALLSAGVFLINLPALERACGIAQGRTIAAIGVILGLAMCIVFSRVKKMPPRG
jgi:hypothetical protein